MHQAKKRDIHQGWQGIQQIQGRGLKSFLGNQNAKSKKQDDLWFGLKNILGIKSLQLHGFLHSQVFTTFYPLRFAALS